VIEFLILFVVLPAAFYFGKFRVPALPVLWIVASYCVWVLSRNGRLSEVALVPAGLAGQVPSILAVFLPFAALVTCFVYRYAPDALFRLVRDHPSRWALMMLAYSLFSVYPQGIIYRAFFFDRYRGLFPSTTVTILMSALAFAYMHIVFRNWKAVVLTGFGGILFALRYAHTGSLFASSLEHALYGCWLFTVGLGNWFYYRAPVSVPELAFSLEARHPLSATFADRPRRK
jgi:hypothetical protein